MRHARPSELLRSNGRRRDFGAAFNRASAAPSPGASLGELHLRAMKRVRDERPRQRGRHVPTAVKREALRTGKSVTVGPKAQPDLNLCLMPVGPSPTMDEATATTLRELIVLIDDSGNWFSGVQRPR